MLTFISASQLKTYIGCPKAWAYDKLDKIERPERASAAEGTKIHLEVERYYRQGVMPEKAEALALLGVLPDRASRPSIEGAFMYLWPTVPTAVVRGFIDMRLGSKVFDHKTVSELVPSRMLTSEELATDPQAVCYGRATRLMTRLPPVDYVDLQWTYVQRMSNRHKTPKVRAVPASQSLRILEQTETDLTPTVQAIVDAVQGGMKAKDLPGNRSYCFKYGKCAYADICPTFNGAQEQAPVNKDLLAQLKALSAATPTKVPPPEPEPEAAPKTERQDPVIPPIPSSGIDFTVLSQVVPPDAAPNVSPEDPPLPPQEPVTEAVSVKRGRGRPPKAATTPAPKPKTSETESLSAHEKADTDVVIYAHLKDAARLLLDINEFESAADVLKVLGRLQ